MVGHTTERLREDLAGFDSWADDRIVACLLGGQAEALAVVPEASGQLAKAGAAMAAAVVAGKTLHYAAAGSSALMAMADAMELPGTFGIDPAQIRILMAGGIPRSALMAGSVEDDTQAAHIAAVEIVAGDVVIAVSASGTTPYPLTIAQTAREKGATVIGIANRKEAELLALADMPVCLATPGEVIAGSTRMGAATAQKVALNIMSTVMGIRLGHVHDGMMVNLIADNAKLTARAVAIVMEIAKVDAARAQACLTQSAGVVKPAVLLAMGAANLAQAEKLLQNSKGHLRPAMGCL